jgi:GT2 family glycosyltransferase
MSAPALAVTIAIPTYRREAVLLETLSDLLALQKGAAEILVLDQTEQHETGTEQELKRLAGRGSIRWIRLGQPSIPKAMNAGLSNASHPLVLFLDDDIRPEPGLVAAHVAAHGSNADVLVAGRVLQPWEEGLQPTRRSFHFASTQAQEVTEFIGCNFSVRRAGALTLGGFDENFVRVAYRFEAEFAHRWRRSGRAILFEPAACLHHLKAGSGGTRTYGEHLATWRPDHAVGAYYYGLRTRELGVFATRPWRAVSTRYHLRRPWRIPATLVAELGGMLWAVGLCLRGPARTDADSGSDPT